MTLNKTKKQKTQRALRGGVALLLAVLLLGAVALALLLLLFAARVVYGGGCWRGRGCAGGFVFLLLAGLRLLAL